MFSRTKKGSGAAPSGPPVKPAVPSLLSGDLRIVGDLTSEGEIHIDGHVDGDVRSKVLLVGETAVVKGEIVAETLSVHGAVDGQIKARTVHLAKTAHVSGDIFHLFLSIEKGAFLEGHCKRFEQKPEAAEPRINLVVKEGVPPKPGEPRKVLAGS